MTSDVRVARSFVAVQFVLIAAVVLLPDRTDWSVPTTLSTVCTVGTWTGIALMVAAALGLGRGLTAVPIPNEHAQLRTGGLYRWVRHPIYSGLLLFTVAQVVASGSVFVAAAGVGLVVLLNAKARWEESRLIERFPDYPDYAARTPRFLPWPRPSVPA